MAFRTRSPPPTQDPFAATAAATHSNGRNIWIPVSDGSYVMADGNACVVRRNYCGKITINGDNTGRRVIKEEPLDPGFEQRFKDLEESFTSVRAGRRRNSTGAAAPPPRPPPPRTPPSAAAGAPPPPRPPRWVSPWRRRLPRILRLLTRGSSWERSLRVHHRLMGKSVWGRVGMHCKVKFFFVSVFFIFYFLKNEMWLIMCIFF